MTVTRDREIDDDPGGPIDRPRRVGVLRQERLPGRALHRGQGVVGVGVRRQSHVRRRQKVVRAGKDKPQGDRAERDRERLPPCHLAASSARSMSLRWSMRSGGSSASAK